MSRGRGQAAILATCVLLTIAAVSPIAPPWGSLGPSAPAASAPHSSLVATEWGPVPPSAGARALPNFTPLMASARIVAAGCSGSGWQVSFDATASGGVPPYNFSWRFGDSSTASNVSNPVHVYAGFGAYTAWATAWDSQGHHNAAPISLTTQHCSVNGNGPWYAPAPASPGYWLLVAGLVAAVIVAVGVAVWAIRGRRPPGPAETPRGQEAAESFE